MLCMPYSGTISVYSPREIAALTLALVTLSFGAPLAAEDGSYEERRADVRTYPEALQLVNEIRSEGRYCGDEYMPAVGPLEWHDHLAEMAASHSRYLVGFSQLTNFDYARRNPSQRFGQVMGTRVEAEENLAKEYRTMDRAIQSWLEGSRSSEECRDIMDSGHKFVGAAGTVLGERWVMNFASGDVPRTPVSSEQGSPQQEETHSYEGLQREEEPPSQGSLQQEETPAGSWPNWRAEPTHGTRVLQAGFRPDPNQVPDFSAGESRVTANQGNSQRVPLQGCEGYINWDAPEIKMEYTSGDYSLTMWGYDPQLGTAILIRSPDGHFHCSQGSSEDSGGAVRFESPDSGTYSIWMASTRPNNRPSDVRVFFSEFDNPEIEVDVGTVHVVE